MLLFVVTITSFSPLNCPSPIPCVPHLETRLYDSNGSLEILVLLLSIIEESNRCPVSITKKNNANIAKIIFLNPNIPVLINRNFLLPYLDFKLINYMEVLKKIPADLLLWWTNPCLWLSIQSMFVRHQSHSDLL